MQHAMRNAIELPAKTAVSRDGGTRETGKAARRPWEAHADSAVLLTAVLAVLVVALAGG